MSEDFLKNPLSLFDIRGKTAIVTGASGAFGALAAKVLAGAGCNLVLAAGGLEALKQVAADCEKLGAKVEAVNIRPNSAANCDKVVEAAVKRFGGVDILVLAAGINKVAKIVDQPPEAFMEVMDVNVTQSWLMARAAGKQMLAQGRGGKVVFMSSARGLLGHPAGYTAYCASKSAIDGVTKALGCEWGDTGITVNAIAPTVFRSPLTAWMYEDTERATTVRKGFRGAGAQGPARRALRSRRPAPVPGLGGVGFLHRPHPLCRRRLYGGLAHVPEKWTPVFREGHAPTQDKRGVSRSIRSGYGLAWRPRPASGCWAPA